MIVGIVVGLLGVGAVALGVLQLSGAVPLMRRAGAGAYSAIVNIVVGLFLVALGVLRVKGLL